MSEQNKLNDVKTKVDEITSVMQENIQFALKNTDKISDIEQKSELLQTSSISFKNSAVKIKRHMKCRYWKHILISAIVIMIIVFIIYLSI